MQLTDFDYHLPAELIAQIPLADRSASRLLLVEEARERHLQFTDLVEQLRPGDLLVVNDTEVLKARMQARKDTGGAAEVLLERIESEFEALCQVRVSKAVQPGRSLEFGDPSSDADSAAMLDRAGEFYRLRFSRPVMDVLKTHGEMPLPPYIDPEAVADEKAEPHEQRYQTVYAAEPGAVAAPTAGLHFSTDLLDKIRSKGVDVVPITLHVGAGTFQPVRVNDVADHEMHSERYFIPASTRAALDACAARTSSRVVAVGTTVVRALESAALLAQDQGDTSIFITPGFRFKAVDALITNFHLPKSTLLMLVGAFAGYERMRAAYKTAVAERYRFFSYGDAMFIPRCVSGGSSETN